MTKAATKSEKKRRRRARKAEEHALVRDPFALEPTTKREPSGRKRTEARTNGADLTVLRKRCKMQNRKETDANLREMRAPWFGCEAGRTAYATAPHDIEDLWQAIQHMRRVVTTYDREIGAPNRHAQCLRLLVPMEAFEADSTTPPLDERSPEKRQDDAVAAYMRLQGWIGHADNMAAHAATQAVLEDIPISDGVGLVNVLRCVMEGIKGETVKCRDRRRC